MFSADYFFETLAKSAELFYIFYINIACKIYKSGKENIKCIMYKVLAFKTYLTFES